MNPKISVIFTILILSSLGCGLSHEEITGAANNYKDYNEFIENVTEFKFNNESHFVIDFSSRGYPSGCIILNNEGRVVKNRTIISAILLMRILKNYDKDTIDSWARISSSLKSFSSHYSGDKPLSEIFLDLSSMSDEAHSHLKRCVFDSSPSDALDYITLEKRILSGVILANGIVKGKDIERKAEVMGYLANLENFLNTETENLDTALDISLTDVETRIKAGEESESIHALATKFIIVVFAFVLILLLIKKFFR